MRISSLVFLLAVGRSAVHGDTLEIEGANPAISKVIKLVTELKLELEEDARDEQKGYDKLACWCEQTLARKSVKMAKAKEDIPKLEDTTVKTKSEIASHRVMIDQLNKDIAENKDAQRDATDLRDKEHEDYAAEVQESEQAIGALEAATKVFALQVKRSVANKKIGFLETDSSSSASYIAQAQLISAAVNVRHVLSSEKATEMISEDDMNVLHRFLEHPDNFVKQKPEFSATQVENPHGDYAPQSTQIQGILKGMYESFTNSVEKANAEEAEKQKKYESYMTTKKAELSTLEKTLAAETKDKADKTKLLADTKAERDNTAEELEADEEFFENSKSACKAKAMEWSERSRLRTEELASVTQALDILTAKNSEQIFNGSSKTMFMQLSSRVNENAQTRRATAARRSTLEKLRVLAAKHKSAGMAEVVATATSGGHFEKVVAMIDSMMAELRKEEQEDIAHKDRCDNAGSKNKNDAEDLEALETKLKEEIKALEDKFSDYKSKISKVKDDILQTETDMKQRLNLRNEEVKEFRAALKMDVEAIEVINESIKAMGKFYKNNKIKLELLQKENRQEDMHMQNRIRELRHAMKKAADAEDFDQAKHLKDEISELKKQEAIARSSKATPEYDIDPDKMPDDFGGSKYSGRSSESGGLLSILEMIVEDLELEVKKAREDDDEAQMQYDEDRKDLEKLLDTQVRSKVEFEKEQARTSEKQAGKEADLDECVQELKNQDELAATLEKDCKWVKDQFESRRNKRKTEMGGLEQAKEIIAGVEAGDYNELDMNS